jgi:hypothetical protein
VTIKPPKLRNPVAKAMHEFTKPARFRDRKKEARDNPRRDHPLHTPYERDYNWRNELDATDFQPDVDD